MSIKWAFAMLAAFNWAAFVFFAQGDMKRGFAMVGSFVCGAAWAILHKLDARP